MMTGRRKLEGEGVVEEDQEENMREEGGKGSYTLNTISQASLTNM